MADVVVINNIEDDSVNLKMQQVADKLKKKYGKTRKINEKLLKPKTPLQKFISVFSDVVLGILLCFTLLFSFATISSKLQRTAPMFAGYSSMRVVSGSMVNSGFEIGDVVVVKAANVKSLKPNDIIAFYTYSLSYYGKNKDLMKAVPAEETNVRGTGLTISKFFGIQNDLCREAARNGAMLTFHHIRSVYEDENGVRWFSTYGSSNYSDDTWLIREELVVGEYDNSGFARFVAGLLGFASSQFGLMVMIAIPIFLLSLMVIKWCIHNIQIAKLEMDIVEEKRKLTDKICVDNNVGYGMDKLTKYKVLAQANADEVNLYLSLLWKNGSAPANVRKFYLKKTLLINKLSKIKDVNRKCEEMIKAGESDYKVAKFYTSSKQKINNEYRDMRKQFKNLDKKYRSQT